jgi:predicted nucleic acid-binding protein
VRLVADANVLLSALIGGRAHVVLTHPSVREVHAAAATLDEVHEYVPALARKKRLPLDVLLLALAALPVIVVERADYERKVAEATRRLGRRDPDDVDVLALALHLGVPVWSNDDDFREAGVEWFTTATLLKRPGVSSTPHA